MTTKKNTRRTLLVQGVLVLSLFAGICTGSFASTDGDQPSDDSSSKPAEKITREQIQAARVTVLGYLDNYQNGYSPCHTPECLNKRIDLYASFLKDARKLHAFMVDHSEFPSFIGETVKIGDDGTTQKSVDFFTPTCSLQRFASKSNVAMFCHIGFLAKWMSQKVEAEQAELSRTHSKLTKVTDKISAAANDLHKLIAERYDWQELDWDRTAKHTIKLLTLVLKHMDEVLRAVQVGDHSDLIEARTDDPEGFITAFQELKALLAAVRFKANEFSHLEYGFQSIQDLKNELVQAPRRLKAKLFWWDCMDYVEDIVIFAIVAKTAGLAVGPLAAGGGKFATIAARVLPKMIAGGTLAWYTQDSDVAFRRKGKPELLKLTWPEEKERLEESIRMYEQLITAFKETLVELDQKERELEEK